MPDNKCRWELFYYNNHFDCNETALPNDPHSYCILHSKKDDKDLDLFIEKVTERIKKCTKRIDLTECYFPKDFPSDYFQYITFDDNKDGYIEFRDDFTPLFDKPVYFINAKFSQCADFSGATFSQGACFRGATFSQANFSGATFSQEAYFSGATFSQEANFTEAKFLQEADFTHVKFAQEADFRLAKFSQYVTFFVAEFSSEVYFFGTTFEKGVNFSWAEFKDRAYFMPVGVPVEPESKKVTFDSLSLFKYVHFSGDVIFQQVNLSKCSFLHSNIDKVDFRYCEFEKKRFRKNVLMDELDCDIAVKSATDKRKAREEYEHVRRLYLELKRNFEEKKDWNKAGDFHFGEMECRRKMKGWLGRKLSLTAFYCWASGYCERPLRTFLILLASVFIFFPLMYGLSEGKFISTLTIVNEYSVRLLDSLNVATLIRLGKPTETITGFWKPIVAVTELIVVPILIALLALALRRKVKR
ncbi:MAG TPA: pentapeptide repeat-containing protein [Candidatus Brocadiia bacterium]|nr:pentapeptide repeat-containing protein [Candidatus Brocadiales bacterium]